MIRLPIRERRTILARDGMLSIITFRPEIGSTFGFQVTKQENGVCNGAEYWCAIHEIGFREGDRHSSGDGSWHIDQFRDARPSLSTISWRGRPTAVARWPV